MLPSWLSHPPEELTRVRSTLAEKHQTVDPKAGAPRDQDAGDYSQPARKIDKLVGLAARRQLAATPAPDCRAPACAMVSGLISP
jgi:hypothetical protein